MSLPPEDETLGGLHAANCLYELCCFLYLRDWLYCMLLHCNLFKLAYPSFLKDGFCSLCSNINLGGSFETIDDDNGLGSVQMKHALMAVIMLLDWDVLSWYGVPDITCLAASWNQPCCFFPGHIKTILIWNHLPLIQLRHKHSCHDNIIDEMNASSGISL